MIGPSTIEYLKDAVLTLRLPAATRRRVEAVARREGRSLSRAAERLIELGLAAAHDRGGLVAEGSSVPPAPRLEGALRGAVVPGLADFRAAPSTLSRSLEGRARRREKAGR